MGYTLRMYNNIIFDADGTLLDTLPGIYEGFNLVMKQMNRPPLSEDDIKPFLGPALVETFSVRLGFSAADTQQALAIYRMFYKERGYRMCTFYPGIPELLDRLKSAGKTLCVATNKPQPFIDAILKEFGYYDRFTVIAGASLSESQSDKSALVKRAAKAGAKPVMVGDRYIDIEAAKAAGVDSIGVLWGSAADGEFERYKPTWIAKNASELFDIIVK